jgi:copper oxidase (laccase) domain-containing protein
MADLKGANLAQLLSAGIPEAHIEVSPYCTWADNDHYFSHRRNEGTTGRMLAVIGIQNKPS